jgi:hypothetical protein
MAVYMLYTCLPACLPAGMPVCPVYLEAQVNLNMPNLEMDFTSLSFT